MTAFGQKAVPESFDEVTPHRPNAQATEFPAIRRASSKLWYGSSPALILGMLRISVQFLGDVVCMKLEGRLAEQWADELQRLSVRALGNHARGVRLEVNLTEVTYIDHCGEEVLRWLSKLGAHFLAYSTSSQWLCERVGLTYELPATRG